MGTGLGLCMLGFVRTLLLLFTLDRVKILAQHGVQKIDYDERSEKMFR